MARAGRLDPVIGREKETERVIQILPIDEIGDLLLNALFIQLARLERVDRRLDGAGRHGLRAVEMSIRDRVR